MIKLITAQIYLLGYQKRKKTAHTASVCRLFLLQKKLKKSIDYLYIQIYNKSIKKQQTQQIPKGVTMDKGFYDYLRSVGYTENGANEILRRFEEGRPDREDKYYLKQYEETLKGQMDRVAKSMGYNESWFA